VPKNVTIKNVQLKGYERSQFEDDFARYLAGTEPPNTIRPTVRNAMK
jgi:hypothetical protein